MIGRTLAIAKAALIEALRTRLALVLALLLLLAVPLLAMLFGSDADTRSWLSRSITTEGLRVVLPLAAIVGGGFLLKPTVKRGWTVLPARRGEYFLGAALAGCVVVLIAACLFTGGGYIANLAMGKYLTVTSSPESIQKRRLHEGEFQYAAGRSGQYTWANPNSSEELMVELPKATGKFIEGTVEYQLVWTGEAAPRDRSPVAVWLEDGDTRTRLETRTESRYRLHFSGESGGGRLVIQPTDPVLIVGTTPDRIRFDTAAVNPLGSVLSLLGLSVAAALLCLLLVLLVRSLSTSPTAVLAGLLLMATLTLLPSLAPATKMAQDRRAAVEGQRSADSWLKSFEGKLDDLPQLYPESYFDEFLAARVVPADVWGDAGWRLLMALALLPAGAVLFRLRQIAK
ncbi:MAG: hypothetical protein KDB82_08790 [Planctomycetes bacterium]|nr:hypothetical protein [Planctomycetota bacterium]